MRINSHIRNMAMFGCLFLSSSVLAAWQDAAAQGVSLETQAPIPVYARFIRTSMSGSLSSSSAGGFQDNTTGAVGTGRSSSQGARLDSNTVGGPMHGMVVVETPLSALKFNIEKGKYAALARVRVTVRDSTGSAVWSAEKEIGVHGPEKKLEARRQGSLFFLRGLTLPGGSEYTVEAKVEDLRAEETATLQNPVVPGAGVPGLNASDAMFVRKFDDSADSFEADQTISFEGVALAPVLAPVFPAGRKFGMQLFFVLYPDIDGGQPELTLQLITNGRTAAQGPLPFKNNLHERAFEGKTSPDSGSGGGQLGIGGLRNAASQHAREFPYLADMQFSQLPEGDYTAVITIRQGGRTIAREVPFKVAGSPPPASQPAN
ncbi:MAG TPA: hypothetical protein VN893_05465 [Bryobacteraceae bacterium]|nr:hypothetical protein [Bryobacteraceae bacterium]